MENKIQGKFTYTIFKTNTYMVCSFLTLEDEPITVTGPYYDYQKNQNYTLYGDFKDHPKYGFQFNFISVEEILPSDKDLIINYLASSSFKGIGKKTALKIYDELGDTLLEDLKDNPELIYKTSIALKHQNTIFDVFIALKDPKNEIIYKLVMGGFTNVESMLIYDKFKLNTLDIIEENPFKFYLDVYGVGFEKTKEFAKNKEFNNKLLKFKEAYLIYIFKEITFQRGDTYLLIDDFAKQYYTAFNDTDLEDIITIAINDKYLIKEDDRYYLFDEYHNECLIADFLNNFKGKNYLTNLNLIKAINDLSIEYEITYDDSQIEAIKSFFKYDISIITGGPGSGKTTVVKSLVGIFKEYFPFNNVVVVAPTGRAAKRISEICDVESKTIHSLLKWDKETNQFGYNYDNPLLYDAIIIDEFSMVDNFLFASLLKAASNVSKICIIGDDNQLPSIRQGNILEDLINTNKYITTKLSYNHRQKEGSEIIELAHSIIEENVELDKYNKDIYFYDSISKESLLDLIDKDIENDSYDNLMVLAPMYKGLYGIDNLNNILQEHLNPKGSNKKEREFSKIIYRENDRIIQLKNRPTDDVYNGDIGILTYIDNKDKSLLVNYQGIDVSYSNEEIKDIALAYALSVHKAQGSEYKNVYFILPTYANIMVNKKLIYTAITRCRNKLVVIGDKEIFLKGINRKSYKRKTTLFNRIIK